MRLTPGVELRNFWGSEAAKTTAAATWPASPTRSIDALIDKVVEAKSREELVTATRALDRVLRAGHYWVPHWYKASHTIAFWDKFARPERQAEVRARRSRYLVVRSPRKLPN